MYSPYAIENLLADNHDFRSPQEEVAYIVDFVHAGLDYYFDSDTVYTHPSEICEQDLTELVSEAHDYLAGAGRKYLKVLMGRNVPSHVAGQIWVAIRSGHGHEGTIFTADMDEDARVAGYIEIP